MFISAYACGPKSIPETMGEFNVGWNMVRYLAKNTPDYNFIVITQKTTYGIDNEKCINNYFLDNGAPSNLKFYYYDHPLLKLKYFGFCYRLYYKLWQKGITDIFLKLDKKYKFCIVHHITHVTINEPTYLYKYTNNFIWGPIGGGERINFHLMDGIGFKNRIIESIRNLILQLRKYNYDFINCSKYSKKILVVNNDTLKLFNKKYSNKIYKIPAIGFSESDLKESNYIYNNANNKELKLIIIGVLYYRKGIDIAIKVIKKLNENNINATLTVVGDGSSKLEYENMIKQYKIGSKVFFLGNIEHEDVIKKLKEHDIFLFPSRRDSGGFAVLEAILNNIPVICLNSGGPSELINVDKSFGWCVDCNMSIEKIVNEICNKIFSLNEIYKVKSEILKNKYKLKNNYDWDCKAKKLIKIYDSLT